MSFKFNGHIIKAITIKKSFSSLIVNGVIDTENELLSKKIYKNICKNWLFIHIVSKDDRPSAIIGMIHLNCVGKKYKTNFLYIDAVIKFNNPIPVKGKYGKWDPPISIHSELEQQISKSMYNIVTIDDIKFVKKKNIYYVKRRGKYMTWENVINSLTHQTDIFIYKLIEFFLNIRYKAYFWECDKVDMEKLFRFSIYESKTLSERKQDNKAFEGKINCDKNVISFPSLSKNVDLVVPCKKSNYTKYTSLSTFSRTASITQQVALWKKVGKKLNNGDWLSTSGLGVSWLHIRIEKIPKYYHNDEFINNYK